MRRSYWSFLARTQIVIGLFIVIAGCSRSYAPEIHNMADTLRAEARQLMDAGKVLEVEQLTDVIRSLNGEEAIAKASGRERDRLIALFKTSDKSAVIRYDRILKKKLGDAQHARLQKIRAELGYSDLFNK